MFERIIRPSPGKLPLPSTVSMKYSLTSADMTLTGRLTYIAVNMNGRLFGSLSFKKTVLLSAAYVAMRSSPNG